MSVRVVRLLAVPAVLVTTVGVLAPTAHAAPAPPTRSCTLTWTAPGSGAWANGANWSRHRTPIATDNVCLPLDRPVRVTLAGSAQVQKLSLGRGRVAIPATAVLTAGRLVADGAGVVEGPGTLRVTAENAQRYAAVVTADGQLTASGGTVDVTVGRVVVGGVIRLQQTGLVRVDGRLTLLDGAALTGDGAEGNRFVSLAYAYVGDLDGFGSPAAVTLDAPAPFNPLQLLDSSTVTLGPGYGATPDFTDLSGFWIDGGTVRVPYPIGVLGASSISAFSPNVVLARNGAPALTSLHEIRGGGTISPLTVTRPLKLAPLAGAPVAPLTVIDLTAPSVVATGGAGLSVLGTVRTTSMALCGQSAARCFLEIGDAGFDGELQQGNGRVTDGASLYRHAVVDGDWTSGPHALLQLTIDGQGTDEPAPSNLEVTGRATLAGTLEVRPSGYGRLPVGGSETLLTATGGPDATFAHVTKPAGWEITVGPDSIVATRRS